MKKKKNTNVVTLTATCDCGFNSIAASLADWNAPNKVRYMFRIKEGWTSDAGTSWPSEIYVACPQCGAETQYV